MLNVEIHWVSPNDPDQLILLGIANTIEQAQTILNSNGGNETGFVQFDVQDSETKASARYVSSSDEKLITDTLKTIFTPTS